jgi:hypothetical protein
VAVTSKSVTPVQHEPTERFGPATVRIGALGDVIRDLLDRRHAIPHRDGGARQLEHLQVVVAIPQRHQGGAVSHRGGSAVQ